MSEPNLLLTTEPSSGSFLTDAVSFDLIQRVAKVLASTRMVPPSFQNNLPQVVAALELASHQKTSPLLVMNSLHIIHNQVSWSLSYIIAAIALCGRFSPLRFVMQDLGEKTVNGMKIQDYVCHAWAVSRQDGERLEGARVTLEMAVLEGWYSKVGSKWVTMPDLMLRNRAAALFGRSYAPEVLMGMPPMDEVIDMHNSDAPRTTMAEPGGRKDIAASAASKPGDKELLPCTKDFAIDPDQGHLQSMAFQPALRTPWTAQVSDAFGNQRRKDRYR